MKKQKKIKRALLMSVISVLMSCAMLAGTTFAWFTDTVTSGNNRIMAGNLDVDLLMYKANIDGGKYVSIADGEGDIFSEETGNGINWEPGKTEIVYLAVRNNGSLALKYNIMLDVTGGLVQPKGGLESSLEYAIFDGVKYDDGTLNYAKSWTDLLAIDGCQTGVVTAGTHKAAENGCLDECVNGDEYETDYFALAIHMKEDAKNEYQNQSAEIDLTVIAGQAQAESDSFGNNYDKDALYAEYEIKSPEELAEAVEKFNDDDSVKKATIKAGKDFSYNNKSLEVSSDKDITIDLAGHDLTINNSSMDGLVVKGGGTLTLTNSEKSGAYKFTSTGSMYNSIYVENDDEKTTTTLNLKNVDIEIDNESNKQISIHAYASAGKSVINFGDGAVVTMTGTKSFAGVQLSENGVMNMTGGVINVNCETSNQDPSGIVLDGEGAILNMSDGEINVSGTGSIIGVEIGQGNGTFNMTGGQINVTSTGPVALAVGMNYSGVLNLSGGKLKVAAKAGSGFGIGINSKSYLKNMEVHLSDDFTIDVDDSTEGTNTGIQKEIQDLIDDDSNNKFTDTRAI